MAWKDNMTDAPAQTEQADPRKQALAYVTQALNEYAATLPPSVRGPFIREAQAAIKALEQ
jgi:hypothetical protein